MPAVTAFSLDIKIACTGFFYIDKNRSASTATTSTISTTCYCSRLSFSTIC
uniref:FDLD family class I lanthipeptide n=1 Tax=Paenimyroides aestuarii TaxID=2968490 RepID=UPI0037C9BCBC